MSRGIVQRRISAALAFVEGLLARVDRLTDEVARLPTENQRLRTENERLLPECAGKKPPESVLAAQHAASPREADREEAAVESPPWGTAGV